MSSADPLVADVVAALTEGLDGSMLRGRLARHFSSPAPTDAAEGDRLSEAARRLQARVAMSDLLDEAIVGAGPRDHAFPLRLFFAELSSRAADDEVAFALAGGLNFYFRTAMGEESKVRVGLECSRLYYRFSAAAALEPELESRLSPLLAQLMTTELDSLRFESLDHLKTFDSAVHERDGRSDATSAAVRQVHTFACRVASNDRTRFKAEVAT